VDGALQPGGGPEVVARQVPADQLVVARVARRHQAERVAPAGQLEPADGAEDARVGVAGELAVAGADGVLAERPERLAEAVPLAGAGDEVAVALLPGAEESQVPAGEVVEADEVEGVGHDRAVAEVEGVV